MATTLTWQNDAYYDIEKRGSHVKTDDGSYVFYPDTSVGSGYTQINTTFGHTVDEVNNVKKENEELKELNRKLKEDIEQVAKKLTKAFEEKLEHERKLRAEAEERAKHLQDEVSKQRRELQRRDESDRKHVIKDRHPIWVSKPFLEFSGTAAEPKILTRRKNTSGNRINKGDNPV